MDIWERLDKAEREEWVRYLSTATTEELKRKMLLEIARKMAVREPPEPELN